MTLSFPPQILQGDSLMSMDTLAPEGSVDLIFTDPPYGIGGDKVDSMYNRDESNVISGYVDWPADKYASYTRLWIDHAYTLLREGGALVVVSGWTHLEHILAAARERGFRLINHVVRQYEFGVWTTRKFVTSHYHILYYCKPPDFARTFNLEARFPKGQRTLDGKGNANYRDRESVWYFPRNRKPGQEKNKNELPESLIEKVLAYTTNPNDLVLDPFMGGGSTGVVALRMGRRFAGMDISTEAYRLAERRIRAVM